MIQPRSILVCLFGMLFSPSACAAATDDATALPIPNHIITEAQRHAWAVGWPRWHGPNSNGSGIDAGYTLVKDFADAKALWTSEALIPDAEVHRAKIRCGYATPVAAAGRLYIFYSWPSDVDMTTYLTMKDANAAGQLFKKSIHTKGDDVTTCIDMGTGRTLWQRIEKGKGQAMSGSGKAGGNYTMCIDGSRVFAIGAANRVYCYHATTGDTIWEQQLDPPYAFANGCPVVVDGKLIILHPKSAYLIAYDPATGVELWRSERLGAGVRSATSPLKWTTAAGRQLILQDGGLTVSCINPADGKKLWTVRSGGGANSFAITQDRLVCQGRVASAAGKKAVFMRCYAIDPTGAKELWNTHNKPFGHGFLFSAPRIYKGQVMTRYGFLEPIGPVKSSWPILVHDLESGAVLRQTAGGKGNKYQAIVVEGRYLSTNWFMGLGGIFDIADTTSDRMTTFKWPAQSIDTSAAYVCGWYFIRGKHRLHALDLRASSP